MKSVNDILEDLYALDPTLREREQELIPLLTTLLAAKPEAEVDENFAFRLRTKLMANNPVQTTPFFRRVTFAAALGVLGLAIAVPSAMYLENKAGTPSTSYAMNFTSLRDNAFGTLGTSQQVGGKGGGGVAAEASKLSADSAASGTAVLGTTEGVSSRMMIAPGEPSYQSTKYTYNFGGSIVLPGSEGTVYRKASGVNLPEAFANTNLGVVDLARFGNLSTQYVTLRQDDPDGYTISIDTTYGTISMYVNEGFWTTLSRNGGSSSPITNAPTDEEIINKATNFLNEFGISTNNYGEARVDQATMARILSSIERGDSYVEEFVNVSWPLLIDGKEVLNSDGSGHGISVTVNLRTNSVTNANIITAKTLEGSGYALETDTSRIEEIVARGGLYGWQPETADKTIDVTVGEPTLVYTLHGTYDESTGKYSELYVPALKFSLAAPEGESYYQSAMVIPLVSSILDTAETQPVYKIMEEPAVDPAVIQEPTTRDDAATSDLVE